MRCPTCNSENVQVKKTIRLIETPLAHTMGPVKMRRRMCRECGRPFQTYELHQVHYEELLALEEARRADNALEENTEERFVRRPLGRGRTDD